MPRGFFLCLAAALLAAAPAFAAAPTVTSLAPASGPIGSTVTVTGTGLTGATKVTLGGVAAGFKAGTATQLTATVPAGPSGKVAVTTSGGTAASTVVFTVTPGMLLSPASGHPGVGITLTASGFAPYTAMDVYFDSADMALVVSNASGVASLPVTVPAIATPGMHWFSVVARGAGTAAQQAYTVTTSWLQGAYGSGGTGYNPFETLLNAENVGQLETLWTAPGSNFANPAPMVAQNNVVIAGGVDGTVRAYSATGAVNWTDTEATRFDLSSPVIAGAYVYLADSTTVFAYRVACGTGGATCKPTWSATPGVSIGGGLSLHNGTLYAPGGDGRIYPLDPATGTIGTPFYAYGTSDGGIVTAVSWGANGNFAYATGAAVHYVAGLSQGTLAAPNGASAVAFDNDHAYYTTEDGQLHSMLYANWSVATSGGCHVYPAPAVANGLVFAGGCSTLGAYYAGTGAARWVTGTPGAVMGVSVANGVAYACIGGTIFAYDAGYGSLQWSGGICSSAPVIANGRVYGDDGYVAAYTLPALIPQAATRPALTSLRRDTTLPARPTPP